MGGRHAYEGLYEAMSTIWRGNAFLSAMQHKVNQLSFFAYKSKYKKRMCIITKSHPPNSFPYVGRKTSVVIWMIELRKKVFNNPISQVPTDNDEMKADHFSDTKLATK